MKMKNTLLITFLVILLTLVGCNGNKDEDSTKVDEAGENLTESDENLTESGFPIVNEPITIKMFAGMSGSTLRNWDDLMIWNKYEEMTNIKVEWEQTEQASLDEKRNLSLSGGDLPDVFYAANMPPLDLFKYGEQGMFVELNDLIDEHAPNLKKLMEENPDIERSITFPNGKIYSLPYLTSPDFTALRANPLPWFDQEWLDKLDMDVPETTDDFYEYLKGVKENSENGEIPYGGRGVYNLLGWLKGAFDVGNTGKDFIDKDPETGEVRFYPIEDNYKELLEYVNKLYSEGLIEQNIYTIESEQYLANGAEGLYASTVFYSPLELFGKEAGEKYVGGLPLEGPYGDRKYVALSHPVFHSGKFVITSENKNPAASVRWADHFYSDEGAKLFYMGIEGETFEETDDGEFKYLDEIVNNPDGLTKDQMLPQYLAWVGVGAPSIIKEEFYDGTESAPQSLEASKKLEPYLADEIWPRAFTYTEEETKVLSGVGSDIEKYVNEMQDKFITGETPFSEWDEFVETLESIGLDKYMEIQEAAFKRYNE